MENRECKAADIEYCDLLFNIRQTMHIVQAQFEVMNDAIEKCSTISIGNITECVTIVNTAHSEIRRFQELNADLTRLFDDFRQYVLSKKL